jgi:hypothetical protein
MVSPHALSKMDFLKQQNAGNLFRCRKQRFEVTNKNTITESDGQ